MFPNDKIIEIFSMCDDSSKNFDDIIQKNSIDSRESIHQKNRPFDVQNSQDFQNKIPKIFNFRLFLGEDIN